MTKIQLRKAFYSSIRRGTGEAWIIRTAHPELRLTDLVIKACLKNEADEPSYEGNRAEYFFRFYELDNEPKRISDAVLNHIAAWRYNNRELWRLLEIAVLLYKAGVTEARDVLISRYLRERSEGFEPIDDEVIIDMDGWEGLVLVAETCGRRIREDGDWADMAALRYYQKNYPETDAMAGLERLAVERPYIAAYLANVRSNTPPERAATSAGKFGYDEFRARVDSGAIFTVWSSKADDLREDELVRLAEETTKETDPKRLACYLRIFSLRMFPLGPDFLLQLIRKATVNEGWILKGAADALALFQGDAIRELALEKLHGTREPSYYTGLLIRNFLPADADLLVELLRRKNDYDYVHWLAYGILDIFRTNPGPHCKAPLDLLYDRINCGPHRADVVKMLAENGVLADRIRAELPFDSCERVRKLANDYPVITLSA